MLVHQREDAQARLGAACHDGDADGAREALAAGADKDAAVFERDGAMGGPCTAAYVAARHGHANVLGDVLLPAPVSADPNKRDTDDGSTPLHAACAADHPDAVTVLLEHGADPNRADRDGVTPCMVTAYWLGRTASLRALAEGAARQEDRELDGQTLD